MPHADKITSLPNLSRFAWYSISNPYSHVQPQGDRGVRCYCVPGAELRCPDGWQLQPLHLQSRQ